MITSRIAFSVRQAEGGFEIVERCTTRTERRIATADSRSVARRIIAGLRLTHPGEALPPFRQGPETAVAQAVSALGAPHEPPSAQDPFEEGRRAFERGELMSSNPHPEGTVAELSWRTGWLSEQYGSETEAEDARRAASAPASPQHDEEATNKAARAPEPEPPAIVEPPLSQGPASDASASEPEPETQKRGRGLPSEREIPPKVWEFCLRRLEAGESVASAAANEGLRYLQVKAAWNRHKLEEKAERRAARRGGAT